MTSFEEDYKANLQKSFEENYLKSTYYNWINQRKEALKSKVSAHDVLRYFGVELRDSDCEEQICCPFHGDSKPSARVYINNDKSSSALYCWVCKKKWDIFELWKEYKGNSGFTFILLGLEKAFNIPTPDAPDLNRNHVQGITDEERTILKLLDVCESRLKMAKPHFQLNSFLLVGKLLDNLHYQVEHKLISMDQAKKNIKLILDKIAEKMNEQTT